MAPVASAVTFLVARVTFVFAGVVQPSALLDVAVLVAKAAWPAAPGLQVLGWLVGLGFGCSCTVGRPLG